MHKSHLLHGNNNNSNLLGDSKILYKDKYHNNISQLSSFNHPYLLHQILGKELNNNLNLYQSNHNGNSRLHNKIQDGSSRFNSKTS